MFTEEEKKRMDSINTALATPAASRDASQQSLVNQGGFNSGNSGMLATPIQQGLNPTQEAMMKQQMDFNNMIMDLAYEASTASGMGPKIGQAYAAQKVLDSIGKVFSAGGQEALGAAKAEESNVASLLAPSIAESNIKSRSINDILTAAQAKETPKLTAIKQDEVAADRARTAMMNPYYSAMASKLNEETNQEKRINSQMTDEVIRNVVLGNQNKLAVPQQQQSPTYTSPQIQDQTSQSGIYTPGFRLDNRLQSPAPGIYNELPWYRRSKP